MTGLVYRNLLWKSRVLDDLRLLLSSTKFQVFPKTPGHSDLLLTKNMHSEPGLIGAEHSRLSDHGPLYQISPPCPLVPSDIALTKHTSNDEAWKIGDSHVKDKDLIG